MRRCPTDQDYSGTVRMSSQEIEWLQKTLARLAKKRTEHQKRLSEIDSQPRDRATRAKVRIIRLELRRMEREIHMHEREIERLRSLDCLRHAGGYSRVTQPAKGSLGNR